MLNGFGTCERCGERSGDRSYATVGDWNSPLWCTACRAVGGAR